MGCLEADLWPHPNAGIAALLCVDASGLGCEEARAWMLQSAGNSMLCTVSRRRTGSGLLPSPAAIPPNLTSPCWVGSQVRITYEMPNRSARPEGGQAIASCLGRRSRVQPLRPGTLEIGPRRPLLPRARPVQQRLQLEMQRLQARQDGQAGCCAGRCSSRGGLRLASHHRHQRAALLGRQSDDLREAGRWTIACACVSLSLAWQGKASGRVCVQQRLPPHRAYRQRRALAQHAQRALGGCQRLRLVGHDLHTTGKQRGGRQRCRVLREAACSSSGCTGALRQGAALAASARPYQRGQLGEAWGVGCELLLHAAAAISWHFGLRPWM